MQAQPSTAWQTTQRCLCALGARLGSCSDFSTQTLPTLVALHVQSMLCG